MNRKNKINIFMILALILFVIFSCSKVYSQSGGLPDIDYSQFDVNSTTTVPHVETISQLSCGPHGDAVYLWESPYNAQNESGNLQSFKSKARYYWTPCLMFLKEPGEDYAMARVTGWKTDEIVIVTMVLLRYDNNILEKMTDRISFLEGTRMSSQNLQPVPMSLLHIAPSHPQLLSFATNVLFPSKYDNKSQSFMMDDELSVEFEIPRQYLEEFMHRIVDGLTFDLRFAYVGKRISSNFVNVTSEISIDDNLMQNFFGKRNSVWATKEQVLDFYMKAAEDNEAYIHLEDQSLFAVFFDLANNFLSSISQSSKNLEDLVVGEILTPYRLSRNDTFMTPDYTNMSEESTASSSNRLDALRDFHEQWKEKKGGGGFKLFGIGGGGKGSGASSEKNSRDTVSKQTKDEAWSKRWQGQRVNPLKQKVYNINKISVSKNIKNFFSVSISKKLGLNFLSTQRNTVRDAISLDQDSVNKILRRYPKIARSRRMSSRRF